MDFYYNVIGWGIIISVMYGSFLAFKITVWPLILFFATDGVSSNPDFGSRTSTSVRFNEDDYDEDN